MRLADLTTLRLGGPAGRYVAVNDEPQLVDEVRAADAAGEPLLVLAGGSNVVVADAGFPGTVVHVQTRGIERDGARLDIAAGEPWDAFVAACVADGLAGIECLSGIPGSAGATPIQNVGAYGQEVAAVIASVRVLDRGSGTVGELEPAACGFGYRTSAFKREPGRHVVLAVRFELSEGRSAPLRYPELARALGASAGDRAGLADVRDAVLRLRRAKGMVLDAGDPDTASAGSFFTNPVLSSAGFAALRDRAAARLGAGHEPPAWPERDRVKTSAAWLIERAGFTRGDGDASGIAVSTKHPLALTNRGGGTTTQLLALAHAIATAVHDVFGIELTPEPVLVGEHW